MCRLWKRHTRSGAFEMACQVSISFVGPLRASQALMMGGHRLESALCRISSKAIISTARKVVGSYSSNKRILSVNRSSQHYMMSCTTSLSGASSYNLDVDNCTEMVIISGYWVGPDADDGWGFVEAIINQMT